MKKILSLLFIFLSFSLNSQRVLKSNSVNENISNVNTKEFKIYFNGKYYYYLLKNQHNNSVDTIKANSKLQIEKKIKNTIYQKKINSDKILFTLGFGFCLIVLFVLFLMYDGNKNYIRSLESNND